jgi:hypothetical protein
MSNMLVLQYTKNQALRRIQKIQNRHGNININPTTNARKNLLRLPARARCPKWLRERPPKEPAGPLHRSCQSIYHSGWPLPPASLLTIQRPWTRLHRPSRACWQSGRTWASTKCARPNRCHWIMHFEPSLCSATCRVATCGTDVPKSLQSSKT